RFQDNATDDAEHGGVGADAETEREQCEDGEPGRAGEGTHRQHDGAPAIGECGRPPGIARFLAVCLHRAHLAMRGATRLRLAHPVVTKYVDELVEVKIEFGRQFLLLLATTEEAATTDAPALEKSVTHD